MEIKKYAVIGNPIKHSWSPFIHQQFAIQTNIQLSYEALKLECSSKFLFEEALKQLLDKGYKGLNVTLPYKTWTFELIQKKAGLSQRAKKAGAVNTITFMDEMHWLGDNTDSIGLVRDLKNNLGWPLKKCNVLILGAGGAASGAIAGLINEKPACIHLLNRDPQKAENLAERFLSNFCDIRSINSQSQTAYHLIINATSSSFSEQLPSTIECIDPKNTYCYDMAYGSSPTPFLRWALANKAKMISDGLGMLVEQAAESFYEWHDLMPNTLPLIKQLRQQL